MAKEYFSQNQLSQFKYVQKLAYDSAMYVQDHLTEGMTEIDSANLLDLTLQKNGVRNFFHTSFAWFGDRTTFKNFHTYFDFLPTKRKLEKGMAVILDTAPAIDGIPCDIGYAFSFGNNSLFDQTRTDLEVFRTLVLDEIMAEKTLSEIYNKVETLISDMGYTNCHKKYPLGVLGHKVSKLPFLQIPPIKIMGFHSQTYAYLFAETVNALIPSFGGQKSQVPYWNETTNHLVEPGVWAIEPHIGKNDYGAKWEELLVVTDNNAYWLDEDLPHVNFWKEKNFGKIKIH